ncbi:DUF1133 family protein [Budviciaceae bacterium CWB-B4]|uniref:DUF1133 family protein n=1 Tax=Limnobaculum xujianqingii TaxID=2738837 RepID=A0A9D7ALJ6_9GAMM|nr:DUF1133 family protein [Limnobaculum xujianqingii]MBK5075159.1 DUF1133 family protein [Limnobaculum xujianqingii]MBK5178469.1 DUF1133 family protein [Limnobaculum xujianqingii]
MIYPTETGKAGEVMRLRTLEGVWIQGKLRMWGRWSYIGGGKAGNMFNRLLSEKMTKTAISRVLAHLKKSGLDKGEMAAYFADMLNSKHKSSLVFCTDSEALIIDGVVGEVLNKHPALIGLLHQRYKGKGMSKKEMARELNFMHTGQCLRTCETRIDTWLSIAEFMLYKPMCDAFDTKHDRFYLQDCAEHA